MRLYLDRESYPAQHPPRAQRPAATIEDIRSVGFNVAAMLEPEAQAF